MIGDLSKKELLKLCNLFLNFTLIYLLLIISFVSSAAAFGQIQFLPQHDVMPIKAVFA